MSEPRPLPTREEVLAKIKECEDKAAMCYALGKKGTAWLWERAARGWRRHARKRGFITE